MVVSWNKLAKRHPTSMGGLQEVDQLPGEQCKLSGQRSSGSRLRTQLNKTRQVFNKLKDCGTGQSPQKLSTIFEQMYDASNQLKIPLAKYLYLLTFLIRSKIVLQG